MSNNNTKPNNNNPNQTTNQNYSNYNQNDYNGQNSYDYQQQNYNNQGYQESFNQQYQNYNNSNQQYQNNQQYDYSNQNYQNNNQYNHPNQQYNYQQYQNYSDSINNQQYQNYNNSNDQQGYNQQYQNYSNVNGQQGYNQQYQNYNNTNSQQGYNQQYQNYAGYQNANTQYNEQVSNNNSLNPNKKKRSKFVPVVASVLGVVLLSGGGLYYYSKSTNKPLSSIFSFGKKSEDKIYTPVLEKYKKAMDSGETKADSDINNFAIEHYNSNGKNKNYIKYIYYDIDGNGKKELIISENNNLNSPFVIYSYDNSYNVNVIYQAESGKEISKTTFYNDKSIWIQNNENNQDRYISFKYNDKSAKFEKVHDINLASYTKIKDKFKDSISNEEFSSKEEFFKKYPIPSEKINFSKEEYKVLYNYDNPNTPVENQGESKEKDKKTEDKPVYSNAQLALIGRALYNNSTDPAAGELNYNTQFTMGRDDKSLMTSFGTGGSIVKVIRTDTGIDIKILDYDKPANQRDFKLVKSVTYKEIQEKFKKEDMDRINKIIEDFKNTKYYKENPHRITD